MASKLVIVTLLSSLLGTAVSQTSPAQPLQRQDAVYIDVSPVGASPHSKLTYQSYPSPLNPPLIPTDANYGRTKPLTYNLPATAAAPNPKLQTFLPYFPVASLQKDLKYPWYPARAPANYLAATVVPSPMYSYQPLTPLGAVGGMKGDLLPSVIITSIIATGFALLFALKTTLAGKDLTRATYDGRRKRSVEDEQVLKQYENLIGIIVPALQSEQCLQYMFCQLGKTSRDLEQTGVSLPALLKAMPTSLAPSLQVFRDTLRNPGPCELYVCPIVTNSNP